jgi:predicted transposase/invertase (TIGR01784 family)
MTERLNPLNDIAFTKTFGEPGCEPQTISLLNAILERTGRNTITEVTIIPHKTLLPEDIGGKTGILDVHARTTDGRKLIVEVQRKNEYNIERRSLFYWSKEYIDGVDAGENYHDAPDVVAVNILDFACLASEDFHTSFHLWEDREKSLLLTTAEEIHFIELPKFRKLKEKDVKGNALHRWLSFLDIRTPEAAMEEIMLTDPVIEKAKTMMDVINSDEALRHSYTLYQMTLMDEKSLKYGSELRGMERGIKKGMKKAALEIARKLKAMDISADKIAAATGLSVEEIEKLDRS